MEPLLAFVIVWLIVRFLLLFKDRQLSLLPIASLALLQAILACVFFGFTAVTALAATVAALSLYIPEISNDKHFRNTLRAVAFASMAMLFTLSAYLDYEALAPIPNAYWIAIGFLLVLNEPNLVIRSFAHWMNLEPRKDNSDSDTGTIIDEHELDAGRMIGTLERALIYSVIVASEDYNVIALVLAAKAFARFRQMDKRNFAEYVLIGTLSSMLWAVVVAQAVRFALES